MPIPAFLLERIRSSAMSGPQVADAFGKLATAADQASIDDCAVTIEYVGDDDTLISGDLIPTITLSLVRQKDTVEPT